jgi:type IV secretory pathway TrbL component
VNWFLVIAAVFVTWVVFNWLVNVLKTTLTTAFTVAAIILVLQLAVGIGPQQLLDTVMSLPRLAIEALQKK